MSILINESLDCVYCSISMISEAYFKYLGCWVLICAIQESIISDDSMLYEYLWLARHWVLWLWLDISLLGDLLWLQRGSWIIIHLNIVLRNPRGWFLLNVFLFEWGVLRGCEDGLWWGVMSESEYLVEKGRF